MFCQIIPDSLLKEVGDEKSLKLSKALRKGRNGIIGLVKSLFSNKTKLAKPVGGRNRETYDCQNKTNLPGKLVLKENSQPSKDQTLNDAHVNVGKVYDFYKSVLGRNSYDDGGAKLLACAHYDKDYNNAFWNGSELVFGDCDGKLFLPFARDLKIITHELSHAVISATSNLNYYGDSGALNESFADIMGICCYHWYSNQNDPKTADWLLGNQSVGPSFQGKALRSFKDEKAYDSDPQPCPAKLKNKKYGVDDNGKVHSNSKFPNFQFYLFCLKLGSPSYETPMRVCFEAATTLSKFANFKSYAKKQLNICDRDYGKSSKESLAVVESWSEIGLKW